VVAIALELRIRIGRGDIGEIERTVARLDMRSGPPYGQQMTRSGGDDGAELTRRRNLRRPDIAE
jgi:hypothetical protein